MLLSPNDGRVWLGEGGRVKSDDLERRGGPVPIREASVSVVTLRLTVTSEESTTGCSSFPA
jgi:hypothetical protein